jgi:hypothetical protein
VPKRFTEVTSSQAKKTLARGFINLADSLRDMLTKFGLRTYKVSILKVEWSGNRRGRGTPQVVSELAVLPTPKISAIDSLSEIIQAGGGLESGSLELTQISGRFTEEQLRGHANDGEPIPANQEFFYEVEFFPHEGPSVKRRFIPSAPPAYYPGRLGWTVRLARSFDNRDRNGDPAE